MDPNQTVPTGSIISIGFLAFKYLTLSISIRITIKQIVYIYMIALSPNLIS